MHYAYGPMRKILNDTGFQGAGYCKPSIAVSASIWECCGTKLGLVVKSYEVSKASVVAVAPVTMGTVWGIER